MAISISAQTCEAKHKSIETRFERNEKWAQEHEDKIDKLVVNNTSLCKQLEYLVFIMKWLLGIIGSLIVGGFIYILKS